MLFTVTYLVDIQTDQEPTEEEVLAVVQKTDLSKFRPKIERADET